MSDAFGVIIHSYTRAEALEDGVLFDVSPTARMAGIVFSTAVTTRVLAEIITPDEYALRHGESMIGRLWDVVWMLRCAIRCMAGDGDMIMYDLLVTYKGRHKKVTLKAIVGPGDNSEPVITIMMPDED